MMNDEFFYEDNRFTQIKRRIYMILLPLFILGFSFILYLLSSESALDTINVITFSILCIGLSIAYFFLLLKKIKFRYIELATCTIGISVFLLRMYRAILFTLGTDDYLYNLGTVTYWASLVFLILFFTFRGNKALIISLIIYSLILAPGLYHFFVSPYRTENTLDTLIQFYISSIGTIVMLYYLQKIIEIYLQAESAHQSANTDYLTKLPNRRKMDLLLNEQIAASRANSFPLTISLFDVDYFKKVNDTYGHDVGDSVLVELSDLLTAYIGQKFYVGRWGGEEFLLVCPGKNLKEIHEYGENIRKVIEEHPFRFVGKLTCSFGVAELLSGDLAKELLKRADEALYQAKESGKNRIIANTN